MAHYTKMGQSGVSSFGSMAIEPEFAKNMPHVVCFHFGTKFLNPKRAGFSF
jgi:hypothetical protein